jgi:ferredoxin
MSQDLPTRGRIAGDHLSEEDGVCRFCVQHGEGEKWYLQARNYAADLTSDLERRGFMLDFIADFDTHRANALAGLGLLQRMPRLVATPVRRTAERRQQRIHFGQPVPIEECESIFRIATSIVRLPCVCRKYAGRGEQAWCLAISTQPEATDAVLAEAFASYGDGPDVSRFQRLTGPEAMRLLREAEERGLMHSVWTFLTPFIGAICNCDLPSGCLAMRVTREFDTRVMWKGESVARVDPEKCTGCRSCVKQCPFEAVGYDRASHKASVRLAECYGCGVCRAACAAGAISLADRRTVPAVAHSW